MGSTKLHVVRPDGPSRLCEGVCTVQPAVRTLTVTVINYKTLEEL